MAEKVNSIKVDCFIVDTQINELRIQSCGGDCLCVEGTPIRLDGL
jgi:hypothetical protein